MTTPDLLGALRAGEPVVTLRGMAAITQAQRLRAAGLSYHAIAVTMRTYHGADHSEHAWRRWCIRQGTPLKVVRRPASQKATAA